MKFRDDIDPENTWVISDTHFGHDNIVGFCFRPEDHEQVMIAEWRAHVPDDGTVLHLGDLCYRSNARFKHLMSKELTGARKLLILGNHDRQRYSFYRDCGFKIVRPFALKISALNCGLLEYPASHYFRVSFSHYPWSSDEDGAMNTDPSFIGGGDGGVDWRIHGHIHNNGYSRDAFVPFLKNHINVSAEQIKYRPVNLKLLLDAALLGTYPETTEAQLEEARARKEANLS